MDEIINHLCEWIDWDLVENFKTKQVLSICDYYLYDVFCVNIVKKRYVDKGWIVEIKWERNPFGDLFPIFIFCDVPMEKKWVWKKFGYRWVVK